MPDLKPPLGGDGDRPSSTSTSGPWRLLLAGTELGAAVYSTIAPIPSVLQGTAPHLFSCPGAEENKRTPTQQGHYLDRGGKKDCRRESPIPERKEEKLRGIRGFESAV